MADSPTIIRSVEYTFELVDNVTPVATKGAQASSRLGSAVDRTTQSIDSQNISYIKAVAAMGAFRHGTRSVVMGLEELGVVSKETNRNLYGAVAVIDTFVGAGLMIKGLIPILQGLYATLTGVAAVETYRKVMANPGYAVVAAAALAAAGGAVGYFMGYQAGKGANTGGGWTNIQNITFNGPRNNYQIYASRSSLEGVY